MDGIKLDRRDGVLTITLSRPERLNAVDGALTEEMLDVLNELARDPSTHVVVLTGEGRGFCSGMDIQGGDPGGETAEGRVQRLRERG